MPRSKKSPTKKSKRKIQVYRAQKRKVKANYLMQKAWQYFGEFLIITGIICFGISAFFLFQKLNPNRLKFYNYIPETANFDSAYNPGAPKYLIIKDLSINLKVVPAKVVKNKWETTYDGVSYLTSSSLPGNYGNSIFYGHNWKSLLGNLVNAKPGQVLEVITDSGRSEKFVITTIQVVSPNDKSILSPSKDARITLYTCTGFMDNKRLVVTAMKVNN